MLLICNYTYSQNYFEEYQILRESVIAEELDVHADSLIHLARRYNNPQDAIKIAHKHSIVKNSLRDYKKAIKYGLIEIGLFEDNKIFDEDYIQALYNLGRFYFKNNDFNSSIDVHQKIVDIDYAEDISGRSYCEIGNCFFALGDYYKATDFYELGLIHLEKTDNYRLQLRSFIQLSNIYEQINTKESLASKFQVLERALELSEKTRISNKDYYALYNSLASYYNNDETFDLEKSRFYQFQLLEKALSLEDYGSAAKSYSNLGNLYTYAKRDSAIYYYQKALEHYGDESDIIRTYNNMANYYLRNNDIQSALRHAHSTLVKSGAGEEIDNLPQLAHLANVSDKYSILRSLSIKVASYLKLFAREKDKIHLEWAMEHIKTADNLIDLLQIESAETQSKLHWRKEASAIYAKAVVCSNFLELYDEAFYFNEKNKSLLLTESILKNSGKSNLPESIQKEELALKKQILQLQNNYTEEKEKEKKKAKEVQKQLIDLKIKYQNYVDSLEILYPKYFSDQQKTTLFSLQEVQKQINAETAIVSYFWDETDELLDIFFGVFVTKNDINVIAIEDPKEVKQLVIDYRNEVSKPFEKVDDRNRFRSLSHELFLRLFPSEKVRKTIEKKHLIIVPDNDLQSIPFEALITRKNTDEYLLNSNEISYAYSSSFLLHNSSIERKPSRNFVGFSPVTFNTTGLDSLPNTVSEIQDISSILEGDNYYRADATKSTFLKNSGDYQIIHLATHADAVSNPWIAFNDSVVKLYELYTFHNQAEMIVLSACNTSLGEYASGEGVLSLARGIFHSGANSVVSSLWNVNDKATTTLLVSFYEGIEDGKSKSEALRNAKLKYIKSHSLSETSPYYWASFILIGNSEPIDISPNYGLIVILVLSVLLITGAVIYTRIKK